MTPLPILCSTTSSPSFREIDHYGKKLLMTRIHANPRCTGWLKAFKPLWSVYKVDKEDIG
jgi:hypothetical protein